MPITIQDIARELNVASSTVSRVLNNRGRDFISEKTRQKILNSAKRMGYRPNHFARALATGRSGAIVLLMPDLCEPFYVQVIHHTRQQLSKLGLSMVASKMGDEGWQNWPIDGLLTFDLAGAGWSDWVNQFHSLEQTPMVDMGAYCSKRTDFVAINLYPAAQAAVRHLLVPGRKRIVYLAGDAILHAGDARFNAYNDVMKEAGLPPSYIRIMSGGHSRFYARETLRAYLQDQRCPEAIFCVNDDVAIGAYRALRDMKLRIPEDVALVGCDGIEDVNYLDPPLSSIVHPTEPVCAQACQFLSRRLANPTVSQQSATFEARFVARESSGTAAPSNRPSLPLLPAFTLVELLVVVAIISILAALLSPALKSARDKAKQIACMSQLKQIGLALAMYTQENDGRYPRAGSEWRVDPADGINKLTGVMPMGVNPPLQKVRWLPSDENFALPSQLEASVQGPSGKAIEGGLQLLRAVLRKLDIDLAKTESAKASLQLLVGEKHRVKGKGPEAYALTINKEGITIKAEQEAGAFNALMTLLQLLEKHDGRPVALACEATDYPDMPLRGVLYGDPEQAARWKMNTIMHSTGYPTSPAERAQLRQFVEECAQLNLKVIPYFITLEAGSYVEGKNPNLAAGVWVKDERIALRGTAPSDLANKCVIRTGLTDVEIRSLDGKTIYRPGKDYQVINGEIGLPYDPKKLKPFAVARTTGSAIPDGATVLASYDHVSQYRSSTNRTQAQIPYCPLEPEARELMAEYMTNLARDYPFEYFNTACCLGEFRDAESHLETDSRVIKSGKRPIELLAEDVGWLDRAAKAGNPKARTLQWACELNEYCKIAGPRLPKDALINIWGYDPSWPSRHGREAIVFWSQLGFTTSAMTWNNIRNVRAWAQAVANAMRKGQPCIGIINACWGNTPNSSTPNPTGGMQETACVAWKIPKKGEKNFVTVE
ncbi:MAG: substrate-binding domain-containing protein [Verrucomicrobia bacterium]|nr:substrate-binding domain-containing protein [Verrucomicrobiota bacterium]